jgi:hypothetical protein
VADELAWACYAPVLNLHAQARRQPPLVFLNGGLSPFSLSRDRAFIAESVAGEPLSAATFGAILQKLPIPMIGVPWHQITHLPDLPVVAHETGHAVESDFSLNCAVRANIESALGANNPHLPHWQAWSHEVFADLWGCLTLGPAYVSCLVDYLATDPGEIAREVPNDADSYPPTHLRVLVCLDALRCLEFAEDAEKMRELWMSAYPTAMAPAFDDDPARVAHAILATPLTGSSLGARLLDIEGLRMGSDQWRWTRDTVQQVVDKAPLQSMTTIAVWAAATRQLYDLSPATYADRQFGPQMLDHSRELIHPGTRIGEAHTEEEDRISIHNRASLGAMEAFADFAGWAQTFDPLHAGPVQGP